MKSYLETNYPQFGSFDGIDINHEDFVVFGLVYALAEKGGYLESGGVETEGIQEIASCVNDILGISLAYSLIRNASTATYSAIWNVIVKLAKRYAGWLSLAVTLWEIGTECL